MHKGKVQGIREVQQGPLNDARGELGCFGTEWWGLEIEWTLDSYFSLILPTKCLTKWPHEQNL